MDFSLTEDQSAIADMAERMFADYCTDDRLAAFDNAPEGYMHALWQTCKETGLHSLYIPESAGGSGLGITELMLVMQAQGQALAAVPLWRHQLAGAALARFAPDADTETAAAAAEGETLLTLALHELRGATGVGVHASGDDGEGWRLNGYMAAVPLAGESAAALLPVEMPEGIRLAYVQLDVDGIRITPGQMQNGQGVADIAFDGVTVHAGQILPEPAVSWLDERGIAAIAAQQLGVLEAQTRQTVEYINQREQFGRAIASFQAVQMGMANASIACETLRTALWQLCYRLDSDLPSPSEARSTAFLACEAGHAAGHHLQHVHGGVGVDISYPIHRFLYWSRVLGSEMGGSSATLESLGDWLADNETLGWKYDLEEHPAL